MDGWIFKGGYPILSVERDAGGLRVSPSSDSPTGGDAPDAASAEQSDGELWSVPVMVRARLAGTGTVERRFLLSGASTVVDLGGPVSWAVVNSGGHGYYRVRYGGDLLGQWHAQGPPKCSIPSNDTGWWTTPTQPSSRATPAQPSSSSSSPDLGLETDLHVWQRMIGGLKGLHAIAEPSGRAALEVLIRDLATTALGVLGFEPQPGEPDLDRELRGVLFEAAGGRGS